MCNNNKCIGTSDYYVPELNIATIIVNTPYGTHAFLSKASTCKLLRWQYKATYGAAHRDVISTLPVTANLVYLNTAQ